MNQASAGLGGVIRQAGTGTPADLKSNGKRHKSGSGWSPRHLETRTSHRPGPLATLRFCRSFPWGPSPAQATHLQHLPRLLLLLPRARPGRHVLADQHIRLGGQGGQAGGGEEDLVAQQLQSLEGG